MKDFHHHVRPALAVASQHRQIIVPEDGVVYVDSLLGHGSCDQDGLARVEALAHGEYPAHVQDILVGVVWLPFADGVVQVVPQPAAGDLLLAHCSGLSAVTIQQILVHFGSERREIDCLERGLRQVLQPRPYQLGQPMRLVIAADLPEL